MDRTIGARAAGPRTNAQWELHRDVDETIHRLGRALALAPRRRRLRQSDVAARMGVSRSAYSSMERGEASGAPIADWVAAAIALGLTPRFQLGREPIEDMPGEGHPAIQELILRMGRGVGYTGSFELGIRPDTRHSIDVALRDPRRRLLLVVEACATPPLRVAPLTGCFPWNGRADTFTGREAVEAAIPVGVGRIGYVAAMPLANRLRRPSRSPVARPTRGRPTADLRGR